MNKQETQVYSTSETMAWNIVNKTTSELSVAEMVLKVIDQNHHGLERATIFGIVIQQLLKPSNVVLDQAFLNGMEQEQWIRKVGNSALWVLTDSFKALLSREERFKGKASSLDKSNEEVVSTIEQLAMDVVQLPKEKLTIQQCLVKLLYGSIEQTAEALFNASADIIGRKAYSAKTILIDMEMEGIVIHRAYGSDIRWALTPAFRALMDVAKYKALFTEAEKHTSDMAALTLEQIAKNVVYVPAEALPTIQLMAWVFYSTGPHNVDSAHKELVRLRKSFECADLDLIPKLRSLGVISKSDPVIFVTNEFNERVEFHKKQFHEGVKDPVGKAAETILKSNQEEQMNQNATQVNMEELREYTAPFIKALPNGADNFGPNWITQYRIEYIMFFMLSNRGATNVDIFNFVSGILIDNLPEHDTLVSWIGIALNKMQKLGVLVETKENEYILTSHAFEVLSEARKPNSEEQMNQNNHPLITLPIMTLAERAIDTGREKNIHFASLERNVVLRSIMRRCSNFLNPLSKGQDIIYAIDYVFYALTFSRFTSHGLSEVTIQGLEQFGYPVPAAKAHVADMFFDAMRVLEEHEIIEPMEYITSFERNHRSTARLTAEVIRLSDEWKTNGAMPGNLADDEMKSDDNTNHMRAGMRKLKMREYLTPLVIAMQHGKDFIDPKWSTQDRIDFLVFGVLSADQTDRVIIFNHVAILLKDNLPSHDVLVDWVGKALDNLVEQRVADFNHSAGESDPLYWLSADAVACVEEIKQRLKPPPVPFEAAYKVHGVSFTSSELYTLIKLLVKFVFMHEHAEFEGGMKVSGLTFNKEKATALLDELLKDKMASFLVQACGYPNPQPKVDSWSQVNKEALRRYIRDYPYGPKTESDIPNGH